MTSRAEGKSLFSPHLPWFFVCLDFQISLASYLPLILSKAFRRLLPGLVTVPDTTGLGTDSARDQWVTRSLTVPAGINARQPKSWQAGCHMARFSLTTLPPACSSQAISSGSTWGSGTSSRPKGPAESRILGTTSVCSS